MDTIDPDLRRAIVALETRVDEDEDRLPLERVEDIAAEVEADLMRDVIEATPGPLAAPLRGRGSIYPPRPRSGLPRE